MAKSFPPGLQQLKELPYDDSGTCLGLYLYGDINIENPGSIHPHLEVSLDRAVFLCVCVRGGGEGEGRLGSQGSEEELVQFFIVVGVWFLNFILCETEVSEGAGMALLKLVDETKALSRWEEMTLQEIPYSSRVTKLSGNNEGMSTLRKGMCGRHSLPWPCSCWFLDMK